MGALIDLTGNTFGLLRVVKRLADKISPSGARQPMWGCICACGRRSAEEGRALRGNRALSCRQCVRDPSRALKYGRVYVMYWPAQRVLKIGWHTSSRRRLELQAAGGIVIDEYRHVDKSWEQVGRQALDEAFPPAFTSRTHAKQLLPRGSGWTDCVTVDPTDIDLALYVIRLAGLQKGNDFGHNPPATATWRRALDGFQSARRRARLGRANADRVTGAVRAGADVAVGYGVDRPAAPSVDAAAPVERSCGSRCAAVGRGRVRTHVGAARPRMDRAAASFIHPLQPRTPAVSGACAVVHSRPIFIGLGERERKKERTRTRACARSRARTLGSRRARERRPLGTPTHTSNTTCQATAPRDLASTAHWLPDTPSRHGYRGMRSLRNSSRSTKRLLGQTPIRAAVDPVRRVAVGGDGR